MREEGRGKRFGSHQTNGIRCVVAALIFIVVTLPLIAWFRSADRRRETRMRAMNLDALIRLDNRPDSDAFTHFVAAERLLDAGKGQDAWHTASKALSALDSADSGAFAARVRSISARLCAEFGDDGQAEQLTAANEKLQPNDPNTLAARGVLSMQRGDSHEASADLAKAALMLPTDRDTWYRAGQAALAAKLYPQAVTSLSKAASLAPNDASIHAQLSDALSKSSRFDEAQTEMQTAARLAGTDKTFSSLLSFSRAYSARTEAEYIDAVGKFRQELASHPSNVRLLAMLAGLQMRFGHITEAVATQRLYLKHAAYDIDGWLVLETLCHRIADESGARTARKQYDGLQDAQDATVELTRQVQVHPNDYRVYMRLCMALHRLGRDRDAYGALQQAARLEPEDQQIQQMLLRVGRIMGSTDEAGASGSAAPE